MSRPAGSVLTFGVYMLLQGATLLVAPRLLLEVIRVVPVPGDVWVRLAGWALCALGFYYVMAARSELTAFFRWTVPVRIAQFLVFVLFFALSWVKPVLVVFSAFELACGLWTALALRAPSAA